jgi:hypothetical protein
MGDSTHFTTIQPRAASARKITPTPTLIPPATQRYGLLQLFNHPTPPLSRATKTHTAPHGATTHRAPAHL